MVALLVILTFLIFLTVDYVVQHRRARLAGVKEREPLPQRLTDFRPLPIPRAPTGVYFAPGHTWMYLEPSGTARAGVTDFARYVLGDVDAAEARAIGESVRRGDVLLRLQRGSRTATFRSPIDGTIEKVNMAPAKDLDVDQSKPYTDSWIYKIRPRETSDIPRFALLGEVAKKWLTHEVERLKVFLATTATETGPLGWTLQDGGFPATGLIDTLNESDWKKLEEKFFGQSAALQAGDSGHGGSR